MNLKLLYLARTTGDKFVSLDDYRDTQGSNCDSASDKQIKGITIPLILRFC